MKTATAADPGHHTKKIKARMRELVDHLRADVTKIDEPQARAMFETSAEVLLGLMKAFDDYDQKNEAAWKNRST